MKKMIKATFAGLLIVPAMLLGVSAISSVAQPTASAQFTQGIQDGANAAQGTDQAQCLFTGPNCPSGIFTTIVNILLFLIGAVAVIMLIIGGFRYVVSSGDQAAVTSAKNTILYSVIGIIVAILAYAIVNFVIVNMTV